MLLLSNLGEKGQKNIFIIVKRGRVEVVVSFRETKKELLQVF